MKILSLPPLAHRLMCANLLGYGVIGNTEVFGTSILGSSPSTPTNQSLRLKMTKYITSFVILSVVFAPLNFVVIGLTLNSVTQMSEKIEDLEGRISLTEGKAILTPGRSCILDEQSLSDESLAFQMTRACLRAYNEQSATTQAQ